MGRCEGGQWSAAIQNKACWDRYCRDRDWKDRDEEPKSAEGADELRQMPGSEGEKIEVAENCEYW